MVNLHNRKIPKVVLMFFKEFIYDVAQRAILRPKHHKSHPVHHDFMLSRGDLSAKGSRAKAECLFVALQAVQATSSAYRSAQVGLHTLCSQIKVCDRSSGIFPRKTTCFGIDL